ncbi:hypothetical protein BRADI_2g02085v3 [Brachypodium distachyon]|uniref:Uncharacterized protein n=1 Tax=Brachypodium distachyon TaxID=15368 RepID=A0A2K2D6I4_BRADI|nr:hypothetical protein BRADI_2g02085v3 [Brachypodium distachyon]
MPVTDGPRARNSTLLCFYAYAPHQKRPLYLVNPRNKSVSKKKAWALGLFGFPRMLATVGVTCLVLFLGAWLYRIRGCWVWLSLSHPTSKFFPSSCGPSYYVRGVESAMEKIYWMMVDGTRKNKICVFS